MGLLFKSDLSATKVIARNLTNLNTLSAAATYELLFNKLASVNYLDYHGGHYTYIIISISVSLPNVA